MKLFLKTKSGANAVGEYDLDTKTMIVKKGSVVCGEVHTDGKFRGANSVIKSRELYCKGNTTKTDAPFNSASTAANFVTGRSTNGLLAWKNSDGEPLKNLIQEK